MQFSNSYPALANPYNDTKVASLGWSRQGQMAVPQCFPFMEPTWLPAVSHFYKIRRQVLRCSNMGQNTALNARHTPGRCCLQ